MCIVLFASVVYSGRSYTIRSGPTCGTVLDNDTGLRWTRCSMNASGSIDASPECSGSHARYNWEDAVEACENLNFAGISVWRLPNIRELTSIITYYIENSPLIQNNVFPDTEPDVYWSSTTYNSNSVSNTTAEDFAWAFNFSWGNVIMQKKVDSTAYVRCVTGP
jgi:hypothetical protein